MKLVISLVASFCLVAGGVDALAYNSGSFNRPAVRNANFPTQPNPDLTPGSLCTHPDRRRYPEKIKYCERAVDTELKREIIRTYDQELGYHIGQMNRGDFKIDHYIPLCAGGSNNADNLWPQHRSVFEITDPMEQLACEKMAEGLLSQSDALDLIREGKAHLDKVDSIISTLESL